MKNFIKYLFYSFLIVNLSACGYNKLVDYEETITKSWSEVETAYAKRADAVVEFTKSLKSSATANKSQVSELENLLAEIEKLDIPEESLSPAAIEKFMDKQNELTTILRKAMDEEGVDNTMVGKIEIVHNVIRNSRRKFNNSVAEYNTYKRQFPQNVTAGPMGFDNYEPLKMDEGSRKL